MLPSVIDPKAEASLEIVAAVYHSLLTDQPVPGAADWLLEQMRQTPELTEIVEELEKPRILGLNALDLGWFLLLLGVKPSFTGDDELTTSEHRRRRRLKRKRQKVTS